MKPWLLNILACPICKEHPITAYVIQVEKNRLKDKKGLATELITHHRKGVLSEPSLEPVHNLSKDKTFDQRLTKARQVYAALSRQKPEPMDVVPLVEYFHGLEIIVGALRCEKCERFYPVGSRIASIPELLPDSGRDPKADVAFLRKHRKVLPDVIVTGSKPVALDADR
ncbi:MAG: Trm112 family protein [Candidatus Hermodarchaeia archaeon]|jgi:uncharacterized protein YbaR (Trm112 family)